MADRGRKRPAAPATTPESPLGSPRLKSMRDSCPELCKHLQQEEKQLRSSVLVDILNGELIERSKEAKVLLAEAKGIASHADAVANGLTKKVVAALHGTHHMSVQLTTWLGTYTPPLSVGGNAGVSAEVQDGMYANISQLVQTCSDGLHRMLAFEKERATMQLRCLEEKGGTTAERLAIWTRYEGALEENQLHELRKTCMNLRSDLLCVVHTLQNNGEHLTTHRDQQLSMF